MRALMPWRPLLPTFRREFDDLFDRFFGEEERWLPRPLEVSMLPLVETFVREGEYVVRADLPGIDPKKVELAVEGRRLTIKGERKEVSEDKERHYREVNYGRFERMIELPHGVDAESVKATYHDGVLEVTMKAPKEMNPRKVPITVH